MDQVKGTLEIENKLCSSNDPAFSATPENLVYNCEKAAPAQPQQQDTTCKQAVILCEACNKTFASPWALTRHHTRFPLCLRWIEHTKITETATTATTATDFINTINTLVRECTEKDETTCKHCNKSFSNNSNLRKHFTDSMCSKFAMNDFANALKKNTASHALGSPADK
jgi:hypothetical protein